MDGIDQIVIVGNNPTSNLQVEVDIKAFSSNLPVEVCHDAKHAIRYLNDLESSDSSKESRIVVLLSFEDAYKNALEFLKLFKKHTYRRHTLFVMGMHSGSINSSIKKEAENLGVYCFVSLPVPVYALSYMIPKKTSGSATSKAEGRDMEHPEAETPSILPVREERYYSYAGFLNQIYKGNSSDSIPEY